MADVKYLPDGYTNITPYLAIAGAAKAIEFYKTVFGAEEKVRMSRPDGSVGHAELQIGNAMLMLADEQPEMGVKGPNAYGGSPINLMVYVDDADAVVRRAVNAGGTVVRPVELQFYGDRSGGVKDPFGHTWFVATHVEDVGPEEIKRRAKRMMRGEDWRE